MRRSVTILFAGAMATLLSGCAAALLPLAAAGAIGKTQMDRARERGREKMVAGGAVGLDRTTAKVTVEQQAKSSAYKGRGGAIETAALDAISADDREYLSRFFAPVDENPASPFAAFADFALDRAGQLEEGEGIVQSTVLIPRVKIEKPENMACAGLAPAVVIDLDDARHANWLTADTLYREDGLVDAVIQLRAAKVAIIWLSRQPASTSERIAAILEEAGLSAADSSEFLFLDRGGEDRRQVRLWEAARNYCIVAIAGDERADFDELYDYLKHPDAAIELEDRFGNGWFLTPPPLVAADTLSETEEES